MDVFQQLYENFRKSKQAELVEKLSLTYLLYSFLHNLHSRLLWEKSEIISYLTKQYLEYFFLWIGS